MPVAEALLTAEQYGTLPDNGQPNELVRGRLVPMNVPYPRHGQICTRAIRILGAWLDTNDLGHVVSNDSGVLTARDPDTVRGPDVAFYSYERVPRGPFPKGYLSAVPEFIIEVRSATDRWGDILEKVGEYLKAGVTIVCILDEASQKAHVYRSDEAVEVLAHDQELTLPEVLPGFKVAVGKFFE